jgi:hypothetical protein
MRTLAAAAVVVCLATPALAANDLPLPTTAPTPDQPLPLAPNESLPLAPTPALPPLPRLAPASNPTSTLAPAANDPLLARLAGDWIGRGLARQTPQAETERVYCKIANVLSADGAALKQTGRCALANQSGKIDGLITALGDGKYGGLLDTLATNGPATLTGTRSEDRLVLVAEFIDAVSHQPTTSTTIIEVLPEGGYRLTADRVDPKTGLRYTASNILFAAQ